MVALTACDTEAHFATREQRQGLAWHGHLVADPPVVDGTFARATFFLANALSRSMECVVIATA
jgi:hypothetical protein